MSKGGRLAQGRANAWGGGGGGEASRCSWGRVPERFQRDGVEKVQGAPVPSIPLHPHPDDTLDQVT